MGTAQGYQLGKTKVFLRAGQMAQLDKLRTELMGSSATTIQRHVRGLLRRRQYQRVRRATVRLQVPTSPACNPPLRRGNGFPDVGFHWRADCTHFSFLCAVSLVLICTLLMCHLR